MFHFRRSDCRRLPLATLGRKLIIRCNQQFVDWINIADRSSGKKLTSAECNDDLTVYLIEAEDQQEIEKWLKSNYKIIFEEELNSWYTDPGLWPQDRSLKTFKEWCSFEIHSVISDLGRSPLFDDEIDS